MQTLSNTRPLANFRSQLLIWRYLGAWNLVWKQDKSVINSPRLLFPWRVLLQTGWVREHRNSTPLTHGDTRHRAAKESSSHHFRVCVWCASSQQCWLVTVYIHTRTHTHTSYEQTVNRHSVHPHNQLPDHLLTDVPCALSLVLCKANRQHMMNE